MSRILHLDPPYHFTDDLPADTRDKLKEIFAHWSESEKAEALVQDIIDRSPDRLGARIVAYRFYFYLRRSREAAQWALACLEWLSARLKLPADWREVTPDMADFHEWHTFPRLWLQSLTAYSYNLARLGEHEASLAALAKVEALDPQNHLGAADLRHVFLYPAEDVGKVFEV
jgi:tetratricopeptide (TPR) repeat protein